MDLDVEKDLDYISKNIGGDALLLEATLYEQGSAEQGIEPNLNRAFEVYAKLYKQGNPVAAYKLGMLAWGIEQDSKSYDNKLKGILKKTDGLSPIAYFEKGAHMNSSYRYQTITPLLREVWGIYTFAKEDYAKTIEILSDPSVSDFSVAQLYMAFAYLELKQTELANLFLNRACNNPNKKEQVAAFCADSSSLERIKLGE
ncbi:hypothetical protein [Helicobacter sp. 12S02634-8]|uniref:hypothetical protein n=1 Tax=Helicobacter sp. 12S02634-8 TaxID=1476199 RepID=UPI001179D6AB|nr:hypothetical protein [Helicobacter sp. 12S02634-8]